MKNIAQTINVGQLMIEVLKRLPKEKKINVAFLGYTDLMMNSQGLVCTEICLMSMLANGKVVIAVGI